MPTRRGPAPTGAWHYFLRSNTRGASHRSIRVTPNVVSPPNRIGASCPAGAPSGGHMSHSFDLVCLSHLRWDFVYQRPQHLLSRCARDRRVFFVEEPIFDAGGLRIELIRRDGVTVVVPHLPEGLSP